MKRRRTAVLGVVACLLLPLAGPAQPPAQDDLRQGLAALNRNDLVHARECLERASEADPRSAVVWVALAQTYLKSGQKDMAVRAAGRAEQFGAGTPPVQHALALVLRGDRRPRQGGRVGAPVCGLARGRPAGGRKRRRALARRRPGGRGGEMGGGRVAWGRHP